MTPFEEIKYFIDKCKTYISSVSPPSCDYLHGRMDLIEELEEEIVRIEDGSK